MMYILEKKFCKTTADSAQISDGVWTGPGPRTQSITASDM